MERERDLDLLRRTAEGDDAAFNILVERYQRTLLNFLYRMVRDGEVAEDLLQETFIRVYRTREKPIENFSAWVFTIASNLARDEIRRRGRRRLTSLDEMEEKGNRIPQSEFGYRNSPWSPEDPETYAANGELRSRIEEAIGRLDEKYRVVVLLRDIEGRTYEEISVILGMHLGTVKSRLNRARLKLQEDLRPYLNGSNPHLADNSEKGGLNEL
ncbi:sigma-70 family RNA polymerase sigma factor [candidate division TA06 bacterium]|nr:sigma-70 family RNA polymerase sigma factor [candidate division TA06 bacterium]